MPAYAMGCARTTALDPTTAPVANPSVAHPVLMDPFSGPKGSPKDKDSSNNASTGGLSTGIGYGLDNKLGGINAFYVTGNAPGNGPNSGYTDDYTPGVTLPNGTAATDSRLVAIGGGKSVVTAGAGTDWARGTSAPVPYTAGFGLMAWGNGASRDGGAGPAFTGFGLKAVTAAADVAVAGVIETGFVNRSGVILKQGLSQFGSASAASAALA
ncbi:MAG: hypothetical protein ACHQX3_06230 [Nitrospirales bacterium]